MVSMGLGPTPRFGTGREEVVHPPSRALSQNSGEHEAEGSPCNLCGPAICVLKVFKTTASPAEA